jgi:ADP-ribose pyrophosphatase YjhB (NUDIX family)
MTQRYTVFLNDRVVSICQDIKIAPAANNITLDFTDKSSLIQAYKNFYCDSECLNLFIKTGEKFDEACTAFNSMFKRIEAAGGIVRNPKQECLFIKRMGKWDLPKGKLHKAEPKRDGALREVTEETGLISLSITKKLPSTFHIYTDRKGNEILKETYWFEMMCKEDQNLVPQLEEDITDVKWFSTADVDIPVQNTYASLRYLLESYFQL